MRKHTEVNLVELASPQSKKEICEFLGSHDAFQSEAAQTAIQSFVKRNLSGDSIMVIDEIESAPAEATVTTSTTEQA